MEKKKESREWTDGHSGTKDINMEILRYLALDLKEKYGVSPSSIARILHIEEDMVMKVLSLEKKGGN